MSVWHGPKGIEVEAIVLGRRARYRVIQVNEVRANGRTEICRHILAYCWTPEEVAQHVDLADLVEVVDLPARAARKAAS